MIKEKLIPELRFPEFKNGGEWDLIEFSKFIKLDRGSSPRPIQEYLTQDKSGVNWIKIGDTKNAINSVIYQVEEKITSKGAEKSRRVGKGELILANSMSYGKTYELAIEGCIYDGWFVLRKYENHFTKPFLLQLLNSDFMQKQYKRLSAGGIVQNISSDIVYNSKLFHVTIPEQQKIASCICSLDEVITANSQKLDLLKDYKKGLMQNLFPQEGETVPKYRFKEFENDGEWRNDKIGYHIESHKGGAPLTPTDFAPYSEYEVIPKKAINEGGRLNLNVNTPTYCSESFYHNNLQSVVDSSYLITTLRDLVPSGPSIGYIVKFNGSKKYILAQGVYGLKHQKTIFPDFLIHFSNSILYRKLVNAIMVGSTQVHIRNGDFFNLPIKLPSILEQQKIASCLSSLDALITAQAEKIEQLKLHKKGLIQGLFPKIID